MNNSSDKIFYGKYRNRKQYFFVALTVQSSATISNETSEKLRNARSTRATQQLMGTHVSKWVGIRSKGCSGALKSPASLWELHEPLLLLLLELELQEDSTMAIPLVSHFLVVERKESFTVK